MLQQGIRGNKRSKEEELRIISDIQKLLPNKDDYEIVEMLAIPNSTYYRYKCKIYKESKKIWKQVTTHSLEHQALQIRKALQISIKVNREIATDTKQPAKDRIQATEVLVQAETDMFRLLSEGPELTQVESGEDRYGK